MKSFINGRLRRKLSLSDDELNCLIALLASKGKGSSKPWIVDDEFREQFNVPNKVHSMFACVSVMFFSVLELLPLKFHWSYSWNISLNILMLSESCEIYIA